MKTGRVSLASAAVLVVLLIAPVLALAPLAARFDWRVLVGGSVLLSVFTFFCYRSDKRWAEAGEWRIPEFTLHLAGFIGGWPGAFLAQRVYHHKITKGSFQFAFWSIVMLHQFFAVDSLLDWRLTTHAIRFIKSQTA